MSIGGMSERLAFLLELDASQATAEVRKFGQTAERELGKADNSFDRFGTRMQVAGAGMLAFAGLSARALYGLGQDAAALEQSVGGTEAVFGSASDIIDRYADTAATAAGLSERAFRESTTLIGGGLVRMGFELEDAAERSAELVQIGADLSATYGGSTTEAVEALTAAFRGEADPAERFNLNLKVSEVNAKAVEMGLASSTSAVDEHARAQALMALILEQSSAAQGQYARESDTATGRIQTATAQIENFKAAAGGAAAIITGQLAAGLGGAAERFNEMSPATQSAIGSFAAYGTAAVGALGGTSLLVGSLAKMRDQFTNLDAATGARSLNRLGSAMGAAGIATAGAAVALAIWNSRMAEATEFAQREEAGARAMVSSASSYEDLQRRFGELVTARNQTVEEYNNADGILDMDLQQELMQQVDGYDRVVEATRRAHEVVEAFAAEGLGSLDEGTALVMARQEEAVALLDQGYTPAQAAAELAVNDHTQAQQLAETQTSATTQELEAATEAVNDHIDAVNAGLDPLFGMLNALDGNATAQARLTELQQSGTATEAELDAAHQAAAESALEVEAAALRLAVAVQNGTVDLQGARNMLRDWVTQGLISQETADEMATAFAEATTEADRLEGSRAITFTTNIEEVAARVFAGRDRMQGAMTAADFGGGPTPGRAAGGSVRAGEMFRGGERGTEILRDDAGQTYVIPGADGQVIPNHRLATAGGAGVVNNWDVVIYAHDVDEALRKLSAETTWAGRGG